MADARSGALRKGYTTYARGLKVSTCEGLRDVGDAAPTCDAIHDAIRDAAGAPDDKIPGRRSRGARDWEEYFN